MPVPIGLITGLAGGIGGGAAAVTSTTQPKPTGLGSVISNPELMKVFMSFNPVQVVTKILGQISDGFDCWGASWTPTRAKKELPQWLQLFQTELQTSFIGEGQQLQDNVNHFFAYGMWHAKLNSTQLNGWIGWYYDTAKDCTKRGLDHLNNGIDKMIPELTNLAKQGFGSLGYEVSTVMVPVKHYRKEGNTGSKSFTKRVPQFTIKKSLTQSITGAVTKGSSSMMGLALLGIFLFGMKKFK